MGLRKVLNTIASLVLRGMECQPPLSIASLHQFNQYVERFGRLTTEEYNRAVAYIEMEEPTLMIVAAPPGSGKTYLLYQLASEFGGRRPFVLEAFAGDSFKAKDFAKRLDYLMGSAVASWMHNVLGRHPGGDPVCLLNSSQAVAQALGVRVHFLVLLDEYPLAKLRDDAELEELTSQMLRKLAEIPGYAVHVFITAHYTGDLAALADLLRRRGAVQKYAAVYISPKISLQPGAEGEAKGFLKKLACGAELDWAVAEAATAWLREGGTFRQVVALVRGAVEGARRREPDTQIERELHNAVVDALRKRVREGRYQGPSAPDLYLEDGRCVEVKVRTEPDRVNPAQHAGCGSVVYVSIAPRPLGVKNEVNVRADVYQIVGALREVRGREGAEAYGRVLSAVAEALAAAAAEKLGYARLGEGEPPICGKLRELFSQSPRLTRSQLVQSAAFRALLKELFSPDEDCVKSPKAPCVDEFAKRAHRRYGGPVLSVIGSDVRLGDLCKQTR
jgi:hypothetical protein